VVKSEYGSKQFSYVRNANIVAVSSAYDKQTYPYCRPEFLYFSQDETALSADQTIRPVLCPKYVNRMPAFAGYAEVINAGKSAENEDMASARILKIVQRGYEAETAVERHPRIKSARERSCSEARYKLDSLKLQRRKSDDDILSLSPSTSSDDGAFVPKAEAAYFAIFDGHAGSGAAIMAANCLHEHIKSRLADVLESALHLSRQEMLSCLKKIIDAAKEWTKCGQTEYDHFR
jgi:protein phosphatase 1H